MGLTPNIFLSSFLLVGAFLLVTSQSLSVRISKTGQATVNGTLTIDCFITAPPTASIKYFKNGEILTEDDRVSLSLTTLGIGKNFQVLIDALQPSDSGTYRCEVKDGGSVGSASVGITVRDGTGSLRTSFKSSSWSSSSSSSSSSFSSSSGSSSSSSILSSSSSMSSNSSVLKKSRKSFQERIAELKARFGF